METTFLLSLLLRNGVKIQTPADDELSDSTNTTRAPIPSPIVCWLFFFFFKFNLNFVEILLISTGL
jgi:hypothetical protein